MKVTVGVSGGIAAYKAAELVRALQRRALDVHVVMTAAAQRFIAPLTFAALTGHKVITGMWAGEPGREDASGGSATLDSAIEHIGEAQTADALVIAPATANLLAKLAHGLADDFLTTLSLAVTCPVIVAPAMNVNMWEHPATRANLAILESRGVAIVAPGSGYLACGMVGSGRMAEPEEIAFAVLGRLNESQALAGETVLVTAGGTREAIDPVRYLGNRSSGKMGYALAEAAASRGARVLVVSAPTALAPPRGCEVIPVVSAEQMRRAVLDRLAQATIVIKAAAVADYRPRSVAARKLKRNGPITIELEPTEDILREVAGLRAPGTLVVGFAAETENPIEHAREKLERKGVDAIIVNDVSRPGLGFDADENAATILTRDTVLAFPAMKKRALAEKILDEIAALRRQMSLSVESGSTSGGMRG